MPQEFSGFCLHLSKLLLYVLMILSSLFFWLVQLSIFFNRICLWMILCMALYSSPILVISFHLLICALTWFFFFLFFPPGLSCASVRLFVWELSYFIILSFRLKLCLCLFVYVWVCAHHDCSWPSRPEKDNRFHGAGIIGGGELLTVGAGKWTTFLCESSTHSELLSHPFSSNPLISKYRHV